MKGRDLYHRICDADSIDAEVSRMSRDELAEVAEYLADIGARGGVPAQVWGAVSARLAPEESRGQNQEARIKRQETRRKKGVATA